MLRAALDQEHKRRRIEAETRVIEAECNLRVEHMRRRMDAETRVIEAKADRQVASEGRCTAD